VGFLVVESVHHILFAPKRKKSIPDGVGGRAVALQNRKVQAFTMWLFFGVVVVSERVSG